MWLSWFACSPEPVEVAAPVAAPEVPVRVDRRSTGPCDAEEMLGALLSAGVSMDGVTAGDELCQGRYGRVVLTDRSGTRTLALFEFKGTEWRVIELGAELGPGSCDHIGGLSPEVCQEMLTLPR